jgi:hypothetical protein
MMTKYRIRFGIALAGATTFFLLNVPDVTAQQQIKVADEVSVAECPDTAFEVAYQTSPRFISWLLERPALIAQIAAAEEAAGITLTDDVAELPAYRHWPELAALLMDPEGMNAPNMGFAYALPASAEITLPQMSGDPAAHALVLDVDGLEPPDIGMAYEFSRAIIVANLREGEAQ